MIPRRLPSLLLFILIFAGTTSFAQPQFRWVGATPGYSTATAPQANQAGALFVNQKGEVYVLGGFSGSCDMDPGPGEDSLYNTAGGGGYLGKYDSSGHLIWAHTFGSGAGNAIATGDSGYYYIAGLASGLDSFGLGYSVDTSTVQGIFIAKYDSVDHLVWVKVTEVNGGDLYSIKVDHSGNIFVCGQFMYSMDIDPAHPGTHVLTGSVRDGFVAKYAPNGDFIWVQQMHGFDGDRGVGLDLDPSGNVLVTGYTGGIGAPTAPFSDTGGAWRTLYLNGGYDAFVAKYTTDGAIMWLRALGGPGHDFPKSILTDNHGNVYTCGYYENWMIADSATHDTLNAGYNTSGYLVKFGPDGNFLWAKNYGCDTGISHYALADYLAKDDSDNVYLTGGFQKSIVLDPAAPPVPGLGGTINPLGFQEYYVLKLDSAGNYKWHLHTYSKRDDVPAYIYLDKENSVYVSGYVTDTTDFNIGGSGGLVGFPIPNPNWTPVSFFAKYAQPKPAGINDADQSAFTIFPNPVKDELTIAGPLGATASIDVFDVLGRICNLPTLVSAGKAVISTTTLSPGIYILQYSEDGKLPFRSKFIKE